jgi:signal transduction histidine kinase
MELDLGIDRRLPGVAEVAVSCVVAESLTNAAKQSQASVVKGPTSGVQTSICAFEGTSLDVEILVEIE